MAKQRTGKSKQTPQKANQKKRASTKKNRMGSQASRTARASGAVSQSRSERSRPAAGRASRRLARTTPQAASRQQNARRRNRSAGDVFQNTIQKTNSLVKEVAGELRTDDMQKAYKVLRTVLQTVRDRLPVEEAVDFGAQLPALVRGFYYEGWTPSGKPIKYHREEFLECIEEQFRNDREVDPVRATQVIMAVLERHVSPGELEQVRNAFPRDFRGLMIDEETSRSESNDREEQREEEEVTTK